MSPSSTMAASALSPRARMPARSEVFIPPGVLLVRNQRAGETAQLRRDAVALVTDDCEHGIEPCGKGRLHRAAHERPATELDEHLVLAHAAGEPGGEPRQRRAHLAWIPPARKCRCAGSRRARA